MAIDRTFISIFKRSKKKASALQFIGIATNYLEAFKMLTDLTGEDTTIKITSGTCKDCRANYARLMQAIKNDGSATVETASLKFTFIIIKANNLIHLTNI
jgi:hypothetical protein